MKNPIVTKYHGAAGFTLAALVLAFLVTAGCGSAEVAEQADDPALRLRAARYLMSYAVKFREFDELADDVRDLRAAVLENK